ncbi:MAG: hypothetical protein ACI4L8_03190 [Candidatus Fimadaptatus sp.]
MTRLASLLLALALVPLMGGSLAGGSLTGRTGSVGLVGFSYSTNGMSTEQMCSYGVRSEGGRYLADIELYCRLEYTDVPLEDEEVRRLEQLIADHGLWDWNGFSKSSPDVLDGKGFSLSASFEDGREIRAWGSNSFPKGYSAAAQAIEDFFADVMARRGIDPESDMDK